MIKRRIRGRFRKNERFNKPKNRVNEQIFAGELRIIDEAGNNLEAMPREAALKLAQEKGLDLVEIAPTAKPPVARIISFDKFRYQKEKELKKQKAAQKTGELKQIRVSARAALNDQQIKVKKLEKFLDEGHKVEIMLWLRGREKYNRNWASQKLEEFLKIITIEYKIIMEPRFIGRGLVVQIAKK